MAFEAISFTKRHEFKYSFSVFDSVFISIGRLSCFSCRILSGESVNWHIGAFIDCNKSHYLLLSDIQLKNDLVLDPVCALFCNTFCVSSLRSFTSNSVPYKLRSLEMRGI